jgi:hypothetical protein
MKSGTKSRPRRKQWEVLQIDLPKNTGAGRKGCKLLWWRLISDWSTTICIDLIHMHFWSLNYFEIRGKQTKIHSSYQYLLSFHIVSKRLTWVRKIMIWRTEHRHFRLHLESCFLYPVPLCLTGTSCVHLCFQLQLTYFTDLLILY